MYDTPVAASVNRTRIVDIPGVDVDRAVRGRQAYHLLSAPALIRYAQERADALQLPDAYRDANPSAPEIRQSLPRYVDACLCAESPAVRDAAKSIARRLGRNLGHLTVTLYRGDPVNRIARTDWPDAAWERWRDIHTYRLGGGVMSGDLGDALIHYAREFLAEVGYDGVLSVAKTSRPRNMGLLGVGCTIPLLAWETCQRALCLDLGQTSIKRAVVHYEDGVLVGLQWLSPVPVCWQWRNRPDAGADIDPQAVLTFTARAIAEGIELARAEASSLCAEVGMSIAAYVRGGRLLGNGLYARMQVLSEDAVGLITDAVAGEIAVSICPILVHDGTAAALLHAGEAETAVLVIGTAIGVGFPPASGLCPIAPNVQQGDSPL